LSSTRQDLAQIIATYDGIDSKKLAREIGAFLLEKRQTASLESLLRDVMAYRERNGQIEATVSTAHDLSSELLTEIKQLIQTQKPNSKKISVFPAHDASVIGGLKVRLANEQLDMTIRSKLDSFKKTLTTEGANQA